MKFRRDALRSKIPSITSSPILLPKQYLEEAQNYYYY